MLPLLLAFGEDPAWRARHAHVLLEPLAQLCAAEDAGVRAAAAETARGVCAALPEAAVAEHFAPFVEGLARHEWFTARSAACAVLAAWRRRAPPATSPRRARPARACLLYTSPSPRDGLLSRMPSSA